MSLFDYDPGAWAVDKIASMTNRGLRRGKRRSTITRGNPTLSEMLARGKEVKKLNTKDKLEEEIQEITTK